MRRRGANTGGNTGNLRPPWKPGQSGNPTGRPKSAANMRKRCRDIVDGKVVDAWEAEVEARGPQWVKCSELLVAYGYGRPKLDVELINDDADPTDELSLKELRELAASNPEQIRGERAMELLTVGELENIARMPLSSEDGFDDDDDDEVADG